MKTKSAVSRYIDDSTRCQQRTASGRRCKLPAEAGKLLCFMHTREMLKADTLDLKDALLRDYQGFQTAQGINFALGNLYVLLASNYISPRRAAVLAFINSLQLRTLPAIDADRAAGILDPTAPEPQASPGDFQEETTLDLTAEPEPEANPRETEPAIDAEPAVNVKSDTRSSSSPESKSPESESREANAKPTATSPIEPSTTDDPPPPSKYRSYWDTIASPTKKPS